MLPLIAGLAVGAIGAIGKAAGRSKANKELRKLEKENPIYSADPRIMQLANQRLGLANSLLNARMPGAASIERNIYTNQANQLGALNRTATDASQALAVASGIGGQTNQSFTDLGIAEAQDYYKRLGIQQQAQQGVMDEATRVEGNMFGDQVRRFGDKMAIRGAIQQNRQNTWGDVSNFGFAVANMAANGGFGGETNRSVINGLNSGGITGGLTGGLPRTQLGNVNQFSPTPQIQYRPLRPR